MVFRIFRKRLLSYLSVALGVFSVYSCKDQIVEDRIPNNPEGKLSAIIDNGLETYASLGGNTGDASRAINWNTGDEVYFLAVVDSARVEDLGSVVAEDINGVNANFVVTPPILLDHYVALYPAANFSSGIGSYNRQVNLSIPTQQTYVADGMPKNAYPMIAVGAVSPLKFKGVAGVLRFELTGEIGTTVNKIVFRSTGVKMSGGSDWIDPLFYTAGSKLSFTTSNACDSVVLSCPSVVLSSTPVSFYIIVADTIYPGSTTEIGIEGSYGRKVYTASQAIAAESNRINARSLFYGDHDMQKEYDAHFIVGDSLESGTTFLSAAITGGGSWLTLSENAAYKSSEQTQTYAGNSSLYIHLDENLTGSERSALIVATRSNGTVMKVLVNQQSAIYAGPFGNYGGASMGSPSEGSLDDSGQATPFSMQLRSGGKGYTKKMYVEAMPEYVSSGVPFASSSISSYGESNKYLGLTSVKASYDKTKYSTFGSLLYQSSAYPAIDYCASKNRDVNGNGILDEDEIKWYMPAINQSISMWVTDVYSNMGVYSWNASQSYWTTTKGSGIYHINYISGIYSDAGVSETENYGVRCVRDGEDVTNTTVVSLNMSGNPTIDLSVLPSEIVTAETKGIAMGDEQSEVNKTVYKELRVAKKDSKQDGTGGYEEMSWNKAVGLSASFNNSTAINESTASGTGCAAYYEESDASDKGSWRLPTQREMQSIWLWKDELENLSGFESFSSSEKGYWTATEYKSSSTKAFAVSMHAAYSDAVLKSGTHPVRCVKEPQSINPVVPSLSILEYIYKDTISHICNPEIRGFTILSNISWTVSVDQSWCQLLTTSGINNGPVNYELEQNTTGLDRCATITIVGGGLEKKIELLQRNCASVGHDLHYTTLEIEPLSFVKVGANGRELISAANEEMIMRDVVVYVYQFDGSGMVPQGIYYVPSVNSNTATVSFRIWSGNKKFFVAANTGGNNSIIYNQDALASVTYTIRDLDKTYNNLNNILASTSSGFELQSSLTLSSGTEGGGAGLIKTMAGGAFSVSNGLLNTMTSYTNNTCFFMSNWDGANIEVSPTEKLTSDCLFTIVPDISLEDSKNSPIGTNNHIKIGLQRGVAKVSFRITADGTSTNESAGYAGPYYSSVSDGSKGRFTPWKMDGKSVWALGNINKHMYPFQTNLGGDIASPNYSLTSGDTVNWGNPSSSSNWYASYDNTRVFGTGKKYGTSSFGISDMKNAMLSAGNYTLISDASGSDHAQVYVFCTENGTEHPQLQDKATFVMIGGEYRPENWISDVKRNQTVGNKPYLGWNGLSANIGVQNVYGSTYSEPLWNDDEMIYYLSDLKVFIHGKRNLYAYYAYEKGIDVSCEEKQLLANTLISNKVYQDEQGELVKSYYRGQCVYKKYITDESEPSLQNKVLVRRNFIYDVNLTNIKGPEVAEFK